MEQTLYQTLNLTVGNPTAPDTGFALPISGLLATPWLVAAVATLLAVAVLLFAATRVPALSPVRTGHATRSPRATHSRSLALGRSRTLAVFTVGLMLAALLYATQAFAATPVTLSADTEEITIDLTEGGAAKTVTTSVTTATTNETGYTLTAALDNQEQATSGITISLTGGDISTSSPLALTTTPATLRTADAPTTGSGDTTPLTVHVTVDSTATPGKKSLRIVYTATANDPAPIAAPTTMQGLTQDYCQNHMATYTGSNEDAVISLTDSRGGTTRTYEVAKLADGNCWMLNNLKLGSTTSTTTLTPTDSNVASTFTLPQVVTTGTADYDNPGVYGPVAGDTGSGATNYGYLYNWSAATAGESRTSHTEADGDAAYSICAAGWRLPTGGTYNSGGGEFAALDIAFGGTGLSQSSGPSIAQWNNGGAFKGVLSGRWWEGFGGQGGWGGLWSASASPGWSGSALYAVFLAGGVSPGDDGSRGGGLGVRCLLN